MRVHLNVRESVFFFYSFRFSARPEAASAAAGAAAPTGNSSVDAAPLGTSVESVTRPRRRAARSFSPSQSPSPRARRVRRVSRSQHSCTVVTAAVVV